MAKRPTIPMTPAQYRAAITALGLNQVQAAQFLHRHPRTSRRWANEKPSCDVSTAMLLRTMIKYKIKPSDIAELAYTDPT